MAESTICFKRGYHNIDYASGRCTNCGISEDRTEVQREYAFDFDEKLCFEDGVYFGKVTQVQTLIVPFFVEVEIDNGNAKVPGDSVLFKIEIKTPSLCLAQS